MNPTYTRAVQTVLLVVVVIGLTAPAISAQQDTTQRINTIEIAENGDAEWTIETRKSLDTETAVSEFQAYVDQVNSSETNQTTQRFNSQFETVISGANTSFERDMSLDSLDVEAEVLETATGTVGVTSIVFTWKNYATTSKDTVGVGEVLSNGYTLSESEVLKIVPPSGYQPIGSPSEASVDHHSVVEWTGPYAFSGLSLQFEYTGHEPHEEETTPENEDTGVPILPIAVIGVGLLAVVGGVFYRRDSDTGDDWSQDELQTEEERVVSLLEQHDGRVKQKLLAGEFDWSDAKVSRVTSNLEENSVLEKLTIGRENVLQLNQSGRADE